MIRRSTRCLARWERLRRAAPEAQRAGAAMSRGRVSGRPPRKLRERRRRRSLRAQHMALGRRRIADETGAKAMSP